MLCSFQWWLRFKRLIYISNICSSILFPAYLLLIDRWLCRYQQSNIHIANFNAAQWDAPATSMQHWKDGSIYRKADIATFLSIHCTISVSALLTWNSKMVLRPFLWAIISCVVGPVSASPHTELLVSSGSSSACGFTWGWFSCFIVEQAGEGISADKSKCHIFPHYLTLSNSCAWIPSSTHFSGLWKNYMNS